jgi:ribosomal protein L11 methyltransferase
VLRLAVRVRRDDAELVLAELLELAPSGVEEVAIGPELIEYAVYGAPGELPALPALEAAAGAALVTVTTTEIADDWSERWREFHRPLVLGERLTVRPPWEPAPSNTNSIDLVIDPGQAFGTGAHATTRLCLELMLGVPAHGPFLDVGCGSGVLAIAAAKLGWTPIVAVDNDPASLEATTLNAEVNGVALDVQRVDVRSDRLPPAGTVAANLLGPLLRRHAAELSAAPARIIASGLLVEEREAVAAAFVRHGFAVERQLTRGEWAALLLER